MKYLRKFFESKSFDEELIKDIEDICLELSDNEISYFISEKNYYPDDTSTPSIMISLQDFYKRFFTFEDVDSVLVRIKDYLSLTDNSVTGRYFIDLSIPGEGVYLSYDSFRTEFSGEELYELNVFIYRKNTPKNEEVYYDTRKDLDGYVDSNELVGHRLWFHTNRTHRNNGWNGMIGIYNCTNSGRRTGLAGKYTNEVRLSSPIYFQSSDAGARTIQTSGDRTLIAGVSGVVIPTNDDKTGMFQATYNPFDAGYFHIIGDDSKRKLISASEVYFNASESGQWEFWVKDPIFE